jgi:hypothetical protein
MSAPYNPQGTSYKVGKDKPWQGRRSKITRKTYGPRRRGHAASTQVEQPQNSSQPAFALNENPAEYKG